MNFALLAHTSPLSSILQAQLQQPKGAGYRPGKLEGCHPQAIQPSVDVLPASSSRGLSSADAAGINQRLMRMEQNMQRMARMQVLLSVCLCVMSLESPF